MRKSEEKTDTKRTVIKTMEEYNNDNTAPAEDVIIMIQVPQSKWDKLYNLSSKLELFRGDCY